MSPSSVIASRGTAPRSQHNCLSLSAFADSEPIMLWCSISASAGHGAAADVARAHRTTMGMYLMILYSVVKDRPDARWATGGGFYPSIYYPTKMPKHKPQIKNFSKNFSKIFSPLVLSPALPDSCILHAARSGRM